MPLKEEIFISLVHQYLLVYVFFLLSSLYWITKRAGEKQGSGLMMANAWHHRSDAISSLVALVGVGKHFNTLIPDLVKTETVSSIAFKENH